ncbi:MAG: metal-sulfur cluster assembly factor [Flavobacteriales bacterium]|jgi:metal-sulfur cluster biosynthetic enzyme|nr:metal-sulfur cluster assembly factor [Flavobacteriales bacterium]
MSESRNDQEREEKALEALKFVDDPEIGLNVVDLGLIYEIVFNEAEKKVLCTMTLTTEFCPMGDSIMANVKEALRMSLPGIEPEVQLTFDPPWNHSMISEAGLEFLGG